MQEQFTHVVCGHCDAVNRIPGARLAEQPNCGACHRPLFSADVLEFHASNFARHLARSDIPLLVDFWAPWCAPCRMMAPAFAAAAARLEPRLRLGKVNTESDPSLGAQYAVRSIPTLILFAGGREVARQAGAQSEAGILRWAEEGLKHIGGH